MSQTLATIRRFRPDDQVAARALILTGLGEHWGFIDETLNPDVDDIAAHYPPESADFFVAEDPLGVIVGTAGLLREDAETGRIVRMSVAKSARGQGLGKRLVAQLEAAARARGYCRLVCETTHDWTDAIALYLATGFTELGVWDDDRHFEKHLSSLPES
ncbi:MAG: GNAT family N-acetyltransferase [Thermomicrobiales bacterium]